MACDNITVLLAGHGVTSDRPCKCLSSSTDTIKTACPHNDMVFSLGVLRNFGRRAEALNERLKNEINLVILTSYQHLRTPADAITGFQSRRSAG